MKTIAKENFKVGAILSDSTLECLFKGNIEDYQEWIEELRESLEGETSLSYERKIPHGDGSNYTIYGKNEDIYIYVKETMDVSGDVVLYFGKYL